MMEASKITKGRYLVEHKPWSSTSHLVELRVIEVSKTSLKVKYISGHIDWITKAVFISEYKIIEVLPET